MIKRQDVARAFAAGGGRKKQERRGWNESLQNTIRALADPIRREILNLLRDGRLSAGEIAGRFPVTSASISRHLSVLREADLIRDTREGKYIYYELNVSVLEEVTLWIANLKGEETDGEAVCEK